MIVLVPASRFRITYEVTEGFPYSQLERLVLRAVGEGVTSKEELVRTFQIHPRLLIESLMTLTHAGWIALGGSQDQQFVLTPEGAVALNADQIPESIVVSSRRTFVLLERVTGTVIPEGEVRYVSKKALREKHLWDSCARLRAEALENKLDESQVQHLLPRLQGQRLHWIGPIDMVSKGEHYIPVSVDINNESIVNLPQRCDARLRPYILESVREKVSHREPEAILTWGDLTQKISVGRRWSSAVREASGLPNRDWVVTWSADQLLHTASQHKEFLAHVLREARTSVFVSSRSADLERLEQLKASILDALQRGTDVNLLWGYDSAQDNLEWMKKLAYDANQMGAEGKLRFNRTPAFSNAKMVLWDQEAGRFRGGLGSYDWLRKDAGDHQKLALTVEVTHPGILSVLAWCAAGVWSGSRSETLSSVPDRWRRIATELEGQAYDFNEGNQIEAQTRIRVVLDREHLTVLRESANTSQARLLIASELLDSIAERRLSWTARSDRASDFTYLVTYGHSDLDEEAIARVRAAVEGFGGKLQCSDRIRSSVLVSDHSACISSFGFLSKHPQHETREIGLIIEGSEAVSQIATHLLGFGLRASA